MEQLNLKELKQFVNKRIVVFHESKICSLKNLNLNKILKKKNPYLFRAKNITLASNLIIQILDAHISSSEEKMFGDFLEELAIYISEKTCSGNKSAASGIDLEFNRDDTHYLVSIKSGPNWGNNAQQKKQIEDFRRAEKVMKQSKSLKNVQSVLGICYGKTKNSFLHGYWKYIGQNFWYFISGNEDVYTDIIEPIGYRAKQHNTAFDKKKSQLINQFTSQFMEEFCKDGNIDWAKLVKFNSGNLKLK